MKDNGIRKLLRQALAVVLERMEAGFCTDDMGVCSKVDSRLMAKGLHPDSRAYKRAGTMLYELCGAWPDGTGWKQYPIPANGGLLDSDSLDECALADYLVYTRGNKVRALAEYQYEMLSDKYEGQQLEYRKAFVKWCIKELDSRIN